MEQSIWINLWICTKPNGCHNNQYIYGAIDILICLFASGFSNSINFCTETPGKVLLIKHRFLLQLDLEMNQI
ncbi:hypothetical protein DERF_014809 [Dermatophagoides farinae]|uniref:Uncharacterized protein n=1 Tax=Dermatophagoides farinae TaxID=6954 RepID=A0A922HK68_DERFA|nr:hypothetical protein DERF_014809 [Dermatophagoides farinae]